MKLEVQHWLIMALIGFIAFNQAVLAFVPIPEANQDMFLQSGSAIMSILTLVAGYYWGKSRSGPEEAQQTKHMDVQADKVEVNKQ